MEARTCQLLGGNDAQDGGDAGKVLSRRDYGYTQIVLNGVR